MTLARLSHALHIRGIPERHQSANIGAQLSTWMQRFAALAAAVPLAYALRPAAARTKPLTKRNLGTLMDLLGGGGGELIAPEKALPGRKEAMPNIEGSKHFVLGTDQVKVPDGA